MHRATLTKIAIDGHYEKEIMNLIFSWNKKKVAVKKALQSEMSDKS